MAVTYKESVTTTVEVRLYSTRVKIYPKTRFPLYPEEKGYIEGTLCWEY